jgi:hypothetical protein
VKSDELKQMANLKRWLREYGLPLGSEAKRQGARKGKVVLQG